MPPSAKPPVLHVLARSERWVVVAKPPRLLVHRTAMAKDPHYALQLLRDQLGQRVNPVHRLDRAASGCLLFSLDSAITPVLQQAMASDAARKTYLALVRGRWSHPGVVDITTAMTDDRGILRDAHTQVEGLGASSEPRASLVRARPKTGRFHQVRRHLNRLSHPVLLDSKHGDSRANRLWREQHGLDRLGLHCVSLDLPLPDGSRLSAVCPLFGDHHAVLSSMPWWDEAITAEPALGLSPLPLGD